MASKEISPQRHRGREGIQKFNLNPWADFQEDQRRSAQGTNPEAIRKMLHAGELPLGQRNVPQACAHLPCFQPCFVSSVPLW
jgi:hypothetical protein